MDEAEGERAGRRRIGRKPVVKEGEDQGQLSQRSRFICACEAFGSTVMDG